MYLSMQADLKSARSVQHLGYKLEIHTYLGSPLIPT